MDSELYNEKQYSSSIVFINLYYDDAEMANPLGSKSGKHKLANFYFQILNMPRHYLASSDSVILLCSIKSNDMKIQSQNSVMQFIIKELKDLWEYGIDFMYNDTTKNVKIAMAQFLGDNLGIHSVMGFSESFKANFPCRRCKMHRSECQIAAVEDQSKLRTIHNYAEDLKINNLSQTGINFETVLNQLPYLHVTENLVFDIMHDVLEGVFPDFFVLMINKFLHKKCLTLDKLNHRLEAFDYGRHYSKSKPSIIKTSFVKGDTKSGQNASQNLCLIICLPLIIGDLVDTSDSVWQLFLILREIVDLILADQISKGGIDLLSTLITEYCSTYQILFSKNLKPKHHHLLHYPLVIEKIGPLKHYWSMAFEAKHKFFKTAAHVSCNFKNLAKTVTYRHQLFRAFKLLSQNTFTPFRTEVSKYEITQLENTLFPSLLKQRFMKSSDDKIITCFKLIRNGCEYRVGCYIMLSECNQFPIFGKIELIVLEEEDFYFIISEYDSKFESHVHSYKLNDNYRDQSIMDVNSLIYYYPFFEMYSYMSTGKYITVPYKFV